MIPQGIAAMCDWALLLPCFYGNWEIPPKTVFVHHLMLPHFVSYVLPNLPSHYRFVLVSSGTDQTIPTGRGDVRFTPLNGFANTVDGGANWQLLTTHSQIIHWYCENHDLLNANVSTLPIGVVEGVFGMAHIDIMEPLMPIEKRSLTYLVAHRLRNAVGQWALRAEISESCKRQRHKARGGDSLCISPPETLQKDHRRGIAQAEYLHIAQNVSFILCVHGGGIDPSPKAWEAIMMGTIPIIQHSTLDDAYAQLPVVFVKDWAELFDNTYHVRLRLAKARAKLVPYYSNAEIRAKVLMVSTKCTGSKFAGRPRPKYMRMPHTFSHWIDLFKIVFFSFYDIYIILLTAPKVCVLGGSDSEYL